MALQPKQRLPGEAPPRWPEVLPGGQAILYVNGGTTTAFSDDSNIIVQSLKTGQRKTLIPGGTSPHYLASGHLVYAQGGRLLAVPFDLQHLEIAGSAIPVLEGVWQGTGGYSAYSLSRDGTLAYVNGGEGLLFDQPYAHTPLGAPSYDVTADGQHFLMLKADEAQSSELELRVVLNWAQEVTRLASAGRMKE